MARPEPRARPSGTPARSVVRAADHAARVDEPVPFGAFCLVAPGLAIEVGAPASDAPVTGLASLAAPGVASRVLAVGV